MKTKIIYISGNEVFNMADIRAAFDEVRNTLGLGADTVMFGVPVDADDALGAATTDENTTTVAVSTDYTDITPEITDNDEPNIVESENTSVDAPEQPQPLKKTRATRQRKATESVKKSSDIAPEPDITENETNNSADENNEKIIPILSILASKNEQSDSDADRQSISEPTPDDTQTTEQANEIITDVDVSAEIIGETTDAEHVNIADMITDDAPSAPIEKTLEQLLESMTPLREDMESESNIETDEVPEQLPESDTNTDDSDATLEQLAAEFAENQDKIPDTPKNDNHSKIGKLKNILPFKKAKREDTGLMGDLFGWAGIAANDDDFSIPGFFTTKAASKK